MFTRIMNYDVFAGTKEEFLAHIDTLDKVNIVSGNPEILLSGTKDEFLFKSFTGKESVIIPDGVGTVLASKIINNPVKCKIAGIEVMGEILEKCAMEGKPAYLLGAQQEVLEQCITNLKIKYPGLVICGSHNGYFDLDNCTEIVKEIKEKEAYALFVAMGCPRQEKFIITHMDELPCKVYMGVGGSFDVFAGKVDRAPEWMIKIGLEWLYRVAKEPCRAKRLIAIPKFLALVFKNRK